MSTQNFRLLILVSAMALLQGCAAIAVGGVAAGAAIAADKRTTGTVIEDQSIEVKAAQAIHDDEDLRENAHVNITSYNTYVLVTGETPTEEMRRRVIDIVRNVPQVSQVHNEITIAAPSSMMSRSSDALITSKVKTKLLASKEVPGIDTKIVTEKGVVYLMGLLTRMQADKATDLSRTTGGVQKVVRLFQYVD